MAERVRIGELLVDTGLISREQLDHVLKLQQTDSRRFGELVVGEGLVSEAKVTQIISQQLSVPWVSLEYIDFSRQLLNLVTREIAEKYSVVPIYVRRSKNRQETLYVAMEDPSDTRPLEEIGHHSGLPVRAMIAPPSDIRAAIRAYYLGLPPEAASISSIPPDEVASAASSIPAAEPEPETLPTKPAPATVPPPVEEEAPASEPIESRDSDMPEPKKAALEQPEMITLTMLDGTTMRLPASKKRGEAATPGELTARDLVEALRAQAAGQDMSKVFGEDVNWERMFAALLSLLLQKHLILDWEFVHELKR